jgi:Putative adhesin
MRRNITLGAILIGVGVGLLINAWFPWLRSLWPLGLIVGGVLLWREVGTYSSRIALVAASLAIPLFGGFNWNFGFGTFENPREIARFESSDEDERAWQDAQQLLIVNTVGDIEIEGDDDLGAEVIYRGNRRNANVPEGLQADYNAATRTLRIVGLDPKLSNNEPRNLQADLRVSVPENVSVEVVNDVGDLTISEVAAATLTTDVGDIQATDIAGATLVHSATGDIRLENVFGEIEVTTEVGDITIDLAEPLESPLRARSDAGDITLELPDDSNVTITATSDTRDLSGDLEKVTENEGRLRLGAGEYNVELSTNVGSVTVRER